MEMSWLPWLLTFLGMVVEMSEGVRRRRGMSYEDMLVNQVLESYRMRSIHARPVLKFNDTLTVKFAVQLTQIMGLDEKDQVLTLNIWDQLEWYDKQIHWNTDEYGGVVDVRVPCDKIWTPDIKLQNYADDRLEEHREALCIVQYDGRVYHVPQVIYRSSCLIDVYVFPFDVQNCTLKFGSWTYGGDKLDLRFYEDKSWIDLTEYVESNSWSIIDVPAYRHVAYYSCCNHPFVDLQYHIIIQRRSAMYNYMLILPCVLLTSITLILFFIPPESPAKMQLGLAVFIAFFLLWKLLEQNLPPGTIYMPLLGTYYCLNMVLITLSSFLNVFIVDLTTHGLRTSSPPKLTKFMFNYLAKCLFMGDLVKPFRTPKTKTRTPKDGNLGKLEDNKWNHEADASNEAISSLQRETSSTSQGGTGGILGEIELKLTELREFTRQQKQRLRDRDRKDNIARQWKAVALVLDRIFFIIYLVMIIASLCYTLPVLTAYKYKFNTTVLDKAFGG